MNILFVVPPWRTTDALVANLYPMPLGAVMMGTILRAKGHTVTIKDFLVPFRKSKCAQPECFGGMGAPPYIHYGCPLDQACDWLTKAAPQYDAIGLCMGQCNLYETGAALAHHIKSLAKPLVIGGPFVSTATAQSMQITGADVAVVGEGESVCERAFSEAIEGRHGLVLHGERLPMAALPLPDWSLAPPANYPPVEGRLRGVLTVSRGCPHHCQFCSVHTIAGRQYRRMTKDKIREAIKTLWDIGVRYFSFLDDNLFISQAATSELVGVIESLRAEIPGFNKARFYNEEGIEVRVAATPGLISSLINAGFINIALGIETLNSQIRAEIAKPYSPEDLRRAIAECNAAGIHARAFYILGFPSDTVKSVVRDLVEFGGLGLAARPNNLKLYPGTETTKMFLSMGAIGNDYDWRMSSWFTPHSGALDYQTIKRLKTTLGAIGFAAEQFGIAIFRDDMATIANKFSLKKYVLTYSHNEVRITGNMFRKTTYRHMAALLLLRIGASSVATEEGDGTVVARASQEGNAIHEAIREELLRSMEDTTTKELVHPNPRWIVGDARHVATLAPGSYDLVFSCPPYYDLEVYSDDPADLSRCKTYEQFRDAQAEIIKAAVGLLKPNRFCVWVTGDIRGPDGFYRCLPEDAVRAFEAAGARKYNEGILVTSIGSLPIRVGKQFSSSRKLGKTHQNVLIFFKGDPKKIKDEFGDVDIPPSVFS